MTDERLEAVIAHPLHRDLGIETIDSQEGGGRFEIVVGERAVNPAGAFHGGVLYLLCDVCAYAGLLSTLDARTEAVTHDIHVSVMRSAARGDRVEFESSLVRRGRTLCFIDVLVTRAGKIIASARVTKSIVVV